MQTPEFYNQCRLIARSIQDCDDYAHLKEEDPPLSELEELKWKSAEESLLQHVILAMKEVVEQIPVNKD